MKGYDSALSREGFCCAAIRVIQVNIGQHPVEKSDTITILEKIGHFLDLANDELHHKYKSRSGFRFEPHSAECRPLNSEGLLAAVPAVEGALQLAWHTCPYGR